MNCIRHNSLSPIHCLRAFHILFFAYLLFYCYCYNHYKIPKTLLLLLLLLLPLPLLSYYFATKHFAADIKLSRCGWIDNSAANTWEYSLAPLVPNQYIWVEYSTSKTIVIPYTCVLSRPFSRAVSGEHSSILWVTWDLYQLITVRNFKDQRTKIFSIKYKGR